jgi:hypothetical protein
MVTRIMSIMRSFSSSTGFLQRESVTDGITPAVFNDKNRLLGFFEMGIFKLDLIGMNQSRGSLKLGQCLRRL